MMPPLNLTPALAGLVLVAVITTHMPPGGGLLRPLFGHLGHSLTCDIAQSALDPAIFQTVSALLPPGFEFARACTWPDEIRGRPDQQWRNPLHYGEQLTPSWRHGGSRIIAGQLTPFRPGLFPLK